jgi:hypothetical protein
MDVNHPRSDGNLRLVEAEQERNRWAATGTKRQEMRAE